MPSDPRQPPYSIEAEQSVLGGMILDNRCISAVRAIVMESDFYRADHQTIFRLICEMADRKKPVDFTTLVEHVRRSGDLGDIGGVAYLGSLANDTPSAANVTAYAALVRERSVMRGLVAAGGDIAELGHRPDGREADELVCEAQKRLMALNHAKNGEGEPTLIGEDIAKWHEDYIERQQAKKAPGIQTGLANLDQIIIGLEPGDFVLAAGATGMGKTVLGLTIAEHIAAHVGPVLGFSLEMPRKQWLTRLVASRGRIPLQRLRDPRGASFEFDDAVVRALGEVGKLPFYISDQSGQSIHQIRSRAMRRQEALRGGLKLVLVDYLQLVGGDRRNSDSRASELDGVSRGLKAMAKDLGCVVLGLAQVGDEVNKRATQRPRLNDLRECKSMTMDADLVLLLYRDEYYNKRSPHAGIVEVEVAKQRNGRLDVAELQWLGGYCAMSSYDGPSASERAAEMEARKPAPATRRKGLSAFVTQ